nr:DUF2878 domain-containing protein [uncultured Desulfobulbus sp.]
MKSVVNACLYQLCWFLAVLGGNAGAIVALGLILLHLLFSAKRRADLRMTLLLLFAGLLIDGTLQQVGCISFSQTGGAILPFWLLVIWGALAMTPNHCLAWLKGRLLLAAVFGGLGGPAAYWGGVRLGGASFQWDLGVSLLVLALIWAILWPVVMHFSVVFDDEAEEKTYQGEQI